MNLWHFNIHTKENGKYMIDNKRAHIGLGNDYIDYTNRKNNSHSTVYQNNNCRKYIKINDIILLYENGIGYIKYGYFTGEIYVNGINLKDKLPNWSITELSDGYCVNEWIDIKIPYKIKNALRKTLNEIKDSTKIKRKTDLINYLN